MISPLTQLLVIHKGVAIENLINTNCNAPVDRIMKFLKMMHLSIQQKQNKGKKLSMVERMQLKELQYALNNLNKRNIFKTTIDKHDSNRVKEMYKQVSGRRSTKFAIKSGPNQQRFSMRLQWINEFSDLGDQMS